VLLTLLVSTTVSPQKSLFHQRINRLTARKASVEIMPKTNILFAKTPTEQHFAAIARTQKINDAVV
jgi:hypothetical protein